MSDYDFWSIFGKGLLTAVTILGLCFLISVIGAALSADAKRDFCYAHHPVDDSNPKSVKLYAHIPWRSDLAIGFYPNIFDAEAAASVAGCSLSK